MKASVESPEKAAKNERRQQHLIAVTSALAGSIVSALLLYTSPAGEGASPGLLLAVTLPGAAAGAWAWDVICGCILAWNHRDELGTRMAALYMILVLPMTAIAAVFGVLGARLLYAFLPVALQITSSEQITLYSTNGLTNAGALGGASAALIAHVVSILGEMRRILRAGYLDGEPLESGDMGDCD